MTHNIPFSLVKFGWTFVQSLFRGRIASVILVLLREGRWSGVRPFTMHGYLGVHISELQSASRLLRFCSYDFLADTLELLKAKGRVDSCPGDAGTWWFALSR
jgi:hypothetical protein